MNNSNLISPENKIIFLPSLKKTNGTGHLVRCMEFCKELPGALIFIPLTIKKGYWSSQELFASFAGLKEISVVADMEILCDFRYVILDRRKTENAILEVLDKKSLVIAIDEGGSFVDKISVLIDILPAPKSRANIIDPSFMGLKVTEHQPAGKQKILVSFGGEDSADLSAKTCQAFRELQRQTGIDFDLTINYGPLYSGKAFDFGWPGVKLHGSLRARLADYDLLVTHYGIAAWEAAAAGLAVILFNPSAYHHALAKKSGFPSIGYGHLNKKKLLSAVEKSVLPQQAIQMLQHGEGISLGKKLSAILADANAGCPVCHSSINKVILRETDRSFCVCKKCQLMYMQKISTKNDPQYSEDYFGEEYRKQYGRTYLEDFDSIKTQGQKRVNRLMKLGLRAGDRILDVGCAYGPFISAASESGLLPYGMDIAESAVVHVRDKLGFPAWAGSFLDFSLAELQMKDGFDALSFWYVLEHFPCLDVVIAKIKELTKPGAYVAMAVPNAAGVSARKSRKAFLASSPRDHFSLFSPKSLIRIMKAQGFCHKKTVVTGHHPERFPFYFSPFRVVYSFISTIFGLGDTFEIYFVRSANER